MIDGKFACFDGGGSGSLNTAPAGDAIKSLDFTYDGGRIYLVVNDVDIPMPMFGSGDFTFYLEVK